MKLSILQKLIIFSTIILVGNAILGYTAYKSKLKLLESEKWVQFTEEVLIKSGEILSNGKDIESASRGFIITNDSDYLEPLFSAEKVIFEQIATLRNLVKDNPLQLQRVDTLGYYVNKRLEYSLKTVELRSKQGLNEAIALISDKYGKVYSDGMRNAIQDIQKEENQLLQQGILTNRSISDNYNKFTTVFFVLLLAFTTMLVIASGRNMMKEEEKKKQSAELIIANKEISFQSHETEIQMAANKELETFSYSVSHDLRAPLRHISGYIDLLMKNNASQLNETGLRYLHTISDSAHEMGSLIDALLTFSRLSRTEIQRSECNTNDMIKQALRIFDSEMTGRNIIFNTPDLPASYGDENLLNQVWQNLISNALKYTRNEEKAIIEIKGEIENGYTLFHISDNGVGFDMKYADKLFGVFQRLHKVRDFEGIGIGLANVNRIIVRHGGTCQAKSEEGKGATFTFSLPNN
ncbi:MAG: Sensor protein [Bacteroidetes bacterium]|nr:MAG: Sensor protein [Bacteroidota bacterium]